MNEMTATHYDVTWLPIATWANPNYLHNLAKERISSCKCERNANATPRTFCKDSPSPTLQHDACYCSYQGAAVGPEKVFHFHIAAV
jgi:hypothetical protein